MRLLELIEGKSIIIIMLQPLAQRMRLTANPKTEQ
jgi:hypothetical protein